MYNRKVKNPPSLNILIQEIRGCLLKQNIKFSTNYFKLTTIFSCIIHKFPLNIILNGNFDIIFEIEPSKFDVSILLTKKSIEYIKLYSNYLQITNFLSSEIFIIKERLYYEI